MTDSQAIKLYEAMWEIWGESLPNMYHHPKQFQYYCKLFKFCHRSKYEAIMNES